MHTDLLIILFERKLDPNRSVSEAGASFDSGFGSSSSTSCAEAAGKAAPRRLIFLRSASSSPVSMACDAVGSWASVLQAHAPVQPAQTATHQAQEEDISTSIGSKLELSRLANPDQPWDCKCLAQTSSLFVVGQHAPDIQP